MYQPKIIKHRITIKSNLQHFKLYKFITDFSSNYKFCNNFCKIFMFIIFYKNMPRLLWLASCRNENDTCESVLYMGHKTHTTHPLLLHITTSRENFHGHLQKHFMSHIYHKRGSKNMKRNKYTDSILFYLRTLKVVNL